MNKPRRKAVQHIYDQLLDLKEQLEELNDEEQESFNNIPENFQGSERYEVAEEIASNLDEAVTAISDLVDYLENVITA